MLDFLIHNSGLIGLLFFVSIFIGVLIFTFNPSKKQKIEEYKFIPLLEEPDDQRTRQ